jgi:hypothetical protein
MDGLGVRVDICFADFKWAIANGCPHSKICIGFLTEFAPVDLLELVCRMS